MGDYGQELVRGVHLRRNKNDVAVIRCHYQADPDRDPALNPDWMQREKKKYKSLGRWQKEQEICASAGAGELVFRNILDTWGHKIIITDPKYSPSPSWMKRSGADHGKRNPTAVEVAHIDYDGTIILCGEYYQVGLSPLEHSSNMRMLPGFSESDMVVCDPSMFDETQAQANGKFTSIGQLYADAGIEHMTAGARGRDLAGIDRILAHWHDLENREPSLKIVCRKPHDKPQYGLHPRDCPNLLWELRRLRYEELTPERAVNHNASEKLVDKDNHSFDATKYLVNSLPEATEKPRELRMAEAIKDRDPLNAFIQQRKLESTFKQEDTPNVSGGLAKRRGLISPAARKW